MNKTYSYYIYILANKRNGTLYVGVTNSLERRTLQHKAGLNDCFTKRYDVNRLVYYERYMDIRNAIKREKQLKAGSRSKKIILIEKVNPEWRDMFDDCLE